MNNNKLYNISLFFFNLLFITYNIGAKSTVFIANLFIFILLVILLYFKDGNYKRIRENIRNKKIIFFFSLFTLYLLSLILIKNEYDINYCWKYIQTYRNISLIFILCYFLGFKINLFKNKTILFICIGTIIQTIKRFTQEENLSLKNLFETSHHAPYSLFLVISILLAYSIIKQNNFILNRKNIIYYIFIAFFIIIYSNNPYGRAGFVFLIFILLFAILDNLFTKNKKIIFFCSLISLFTISYIVLFNELIINKSINSSNTKDPRFIMWKASVDIIRENISIFGQGLCYSQELVSEKLNSINFPETLSESGHFHFHNTYIDSIINSGIIGFILTLIIMFFPLLYSFWIKNKIFIVLSLIFIIQSFVEPILSVDLFILIHTFFITIIFIHEKNNNIS